MLKLLGFLVVSLTVLCSTEAGAYQRRIDFHGTIVGVDTVGPLPADFAGLSGVQGFVLGSNFTTFMIYNDTWGYELPGVPNYRFDDGTAVPVMNEIGNVNAFPFGVGSLGGKGFDEVGTNATDGFFYRLNPVGPIHIYAAFFGPNRPQTLAWKTHQVTGTGFGYVKSGAGWAGLNITSMSISVVPEPSTWATLIVGFGLAGATLRQAGCRNSRSRSSTPVTGQRRQRAV